MAKPRTRMQLPSDASEAVALLKLNGWPQDAMDDVAAGRARLIPLTHNKFTVVDAMDFAELQQFNWYIDKDGYARRGAHASDSVLNPIYMHRQLAKTPFGVITDHKNHNTLDNRKSNLRHATTSESICNRRKPKSNTTGFKGVTHDQKSKKFTAQIARFRKLHRIGVFDTAIDAHAAYCAAARQLHGDFASFQ